MKYLLLLLLLLCICFIGQENCQAQKQISYQDSVYLIIKGNMSNMDSVGVNIWNNLSIYNRAYNRFIHHLYVKDNKLVWNIKKGADIKISENIYQYLNYCFTYDNEVNLPSGEYEIRIDEKDNCYYVIPKKTPMEGYRRIQP